MTIEQIREFVKNPRTEDGFPKYVITDDHWVICARCIVRDWRTVDSAMRNNDRMNGWFIVDIRTLECEADIPCSVCDKWL